jgi:hypothetical protein
VGVLTEDQQARLQHLICRYSNYREFVNALVPPLGMTEARKELGRKPLEE